jgi:hypothetical protein
VAVDDGVRVPRLGVEVRLPVTLPGGRVAIEVLRETDLTRVVGGDDDDEEEDDDGGDDGGDDTTRPAHHHRAAARGPTGAARASARLVEAAGFRVLAVNGARWLALPGDGVRDAALAALLAPFRQE